MEKRRQPDDWGHVKGPFSVEHTQCSSASLSLPFPFFPRIWEQKWLRRVRIDRICKDSVGFTFLWMVHVTLTFLIHLMAAATKNMQNILFFDLWLWSLLSLSECIDLNYIPKSLGDTKILSCIEFTFKFFTQQGQVITFMILEVEDYQLFLYWAEKMIL